MVETSIKRHLSGSTNGRPISCTNSPAVLLHTMGNGARQLVHLVVTNESGGALDFVLDFTGSGPTIQFRVGANNHISFDFVAQVGQQFYGNVGTAGTLKVIGYVENLGDDL